MSNPKRQVMLKSDGGCVGWVRVRPKKGEALTLHGFKCLVVSVGLKVLVLQILVRLDLEEFDIEGS